MLIKIKTSPERPVSGCDNRCHHQDLGIYFCFMFASNRDARLGPI